MKRAILSALFVLLFFSPAAEAQQSRDVGDYVIHYNALNTDLISPQVAQQYGIRRSSSRAMLNVTVLRKQPEAENIAVHATVTGTAKNLTGQIRDIEFREINESSDAIYYISELSVRNMETFDFSLEVQPEGSGDSYTVKFRQQFYTE